MLLSCQQGGNKPEEPVVDSYKIPCSCGAEWQNQAPVCRDDLAWDYPVKPGSDEWEQIESTHGRIAICQIPEDILTSLATEDLTDICLHYPLLNFDLFFYRPHEIGLDMLFQKFNGVRELFNREDALSAILNWYSCAMQNLSYLDSEATDAEKGAFVLRIAAATLLLSRCQATDEPIIEDDVKIVKLLLCGYEKMPLYSNGFGSESFAASCFTRAKIMTRIDEQTLAKIPQGSNNPLFIRCDLDEETRLAIDEMTCQFIK